MTARALVLFVASFAPGCFLAAPVEPNRQVTVARGLNATASALTLVYDARVCEVTVRDVSGTVVDQRELNGRMMPLTKQPLPGEVTRQLCESLMTKPQRDEFDKKISWPATGHEPEPPPDAARRLRTTFGRQSPLHRRHFG